MDTNQDRILDHLYGELEPEEELDLLNEVEVNDGLAEELATTRRILTAYRLAPAPTPKPHAEVAARALEEARSIRQQPEPDAEPMVWETAAAHTRAEENLAEGLEPSFWDHAWKLAALFVLCFGLAAVIMIEPWKPAAYLRHMETATGVHAIPERAPSAPSVTSATSDLPGTMPGADSPVSPAQRDPGALAYAERERPRKTDPSVPHTPLDAHTSRRIAIDSSRRADPDMTQDQAAAVPDDGVISEPSEKTDADVRDRETMPPLLAEKEGTRVAVVPPDLNRLLPPASLPELPHLADPESEEAPGVPPVPTDLVADAESGTPPEPDLADARPAPPLVPGIPEMPAEMAKGADTAEVADDPDIRDVPNVADSTTDPHPTLALAPTELDTPSANYRRERERRSLKIAGRIEPRDKWSEELPSAEPMDAGQVPADPSPREDSSPLPALDLPLEGVTARPSPPEDERMLRDRVEDIVARQRADSTQDTILQGVPAIRPDSEAPLARGLVTDSPDSGVTPDSPEEPVAPSADPPSQPPLVAEAPSREPLAERLAQRTTEMEKPSAPDATPPEMDGRMAHAVTMPPPEEVEVGDRISLMEETVVDDLVAVGINIEMDIEMDIDLDQDLEADPRARAQEPASLALRRTTQDPATPIPAPGATRDDPPAVDDMEDPAIRLRRAKIAYDLRDYDRAWQDLASPLEPGTPEDIRIELYALRARTALQRRQFDEMDDAIRALHPLAPLTAQALWRLREEAMRPAPARRTVVPSAPRPAPRGPAPDPSPAPRPFRPTTDPYERSLQP